LLQGFLFSTTSVHVVCNLIVTGHCTVQYGHDPIHGWLQHTLGITTVLQEQADKAVIDLKRLYNRGKKRAKAAAASDKPSSGAAAAAALLRAAEPAGKQQQQQGSIGSLGQLPTGAGDNQPAATPSRGAPLGRSLTPLKTQSQDGLGGSSQQQGQAAAGAGAGAGAAAPRQEEFSKPGGEWMDLTV
jgi:hypothetical protein